MQNSWINFLSDLGGIYQTNNGFVFPPHPDRNQLCPITSFSIIAVSGEHAETFLQGQLTCNIKEITHQQASLAAFCNAKGRVISTLLIYKHANSFYLLLPESLQEQVAKRLQMYILRSKVVLASVTEQHCLIGFTLSEEKASADELPEHAFSIVDIDNTACIKLPGQTLNRYLLLAECDHAAKLWQHISTRYRLTPTSSAAWTDDDITCGMPWIDKNNSEQYIPQMLNIDKLGGISFDKGCYTGQEIVARTHYLGKAKREMLLGRCSANAEFSIETAIIKRNTQESVGKILTFSRQDGECHLLFVLSAIETNQHLLALANENQDAIEVLPFQ